MLARAPVVCEGKGAVATGRGQRYDTAMLGQMAGVCLVGASWLTAQCGGIVVERGAIAGVGAWQFIPYVGASANWDPDGAGPSPEQIVLAGRFSYAGTVACSDMVLVDPATGSCAPFGTGLVGSFEQLAVMPTGELVAAGYFSLGWPPVVLPSVLQWNGSMWAPLGVGLQGYVTTMVVHPDGSLLAAGTQLRLPSTVPPNSSTFEAVLRWHNGAWTSLGMGGLVKCLAVDGNGDVWAGGGFTTIGGVAATNLARWDGAQWHAVGWTGGEVVGLHVQGVTDVHVVDKVGPLGGPFTTRVRHRSGGGWIAFGQPVAGATYASAMRANGEVWLAGTFSMGKAIRSTGGAWLSAGSFEPDYLGNYTHVGHLRRLPTDEILVGGQFDTVAGVGACCTAVHDGNAWRSLVPGSNDGFVCIVEGDAGATFVAGFFEQIGGVAANHVARWEGGAWHSLAGGTDDDCWTMVRLANGDIVVGGEFTSAGGVAAARVARWNGTNWAPLGAGLTGTVYSLQEIDGVLFAGGANVAPVGGGPPSLCAFVGGSWLSVAPPAGPLLRRANGELWTANGTVQRWNGVAWIDVPGLPTSYMPHRFLEAANGDVYVSGQDNYQHPIWRWSAGAWAEVGTGLYGSAPELQFLPDGRLLASGSISIGWNNSGTIPSTIVWDGTAWSFWGTGTNAAATLRSDFSELWLMGGYPGWNGTTGFSYVRVLPQCPATAIAYGAGCSTGSTNLELRCTAGAWLGGAFRSEATGLPATMPAVGLFGWQAMALPFSLVLPWAGPGCTLLVAPSLVVPATATPTGPTFTVAIPPTVTLVGQQMWHQAFGVVGTSGSFFGVTSNGLHCTIGTW